MTVIGQIVNMKDSLRLLVVSTALISMTISCANHEIVVQKSYINKMSIYPDSSFVGDIRGLQFNNNHLFFLDINRRSLLILDRELSDIHSVSRGGRSKEELLEPFSFTVSGDSVFVIDFGNLKMKSYIKGEFIGEKSIPVNTRDQRFVKDGNLFFLPVRDSDASVVKTSLSGSPITVLQAEEFFSPVKTMTMNSCHILSYEGNLAIIPEALPWVKILSKDGRFIRTIDLLSSATYRRNISFAKKAETEENSFYVLNCDACIKGDTLLILTPTYGSYYACNRIVSVNLKTGETSETIMLLSGEVYSTFCTDGERLYAFNSSETQLEVYEM